MTYERIRISPSKLEKFRLHRDGEYNGVITKQKVIESIKGESKWSPKATFGTAFHAVIENGKDRYYKPETGMYHVLEEEMPNEIVFTENEVIAAEEFRNRYPNMVYESWVWYTLYVDNRQVTFLMKLDGLNGLQVHEQKTSDRACNIEQYERSAQWKLYYLALQPAFVQYNHFHYIKHKGDSEHKIKHTPFRFYNYPDLKTDIAGLTRHFLEFCDHNNLNDYIYK